jgi:hypothetical protein
VNGVIFQHITNNKIFQQDKKLLTAVLNGLEINFHKPESTILDEGDESNELCFLSNGL